MWVMMKRHVSASCGLPLLVMLVGAWQACAAELEPRIVDGGVLLQCHAPAADAVYLAGSFNNWANNQDGLILDERFAMEGPDDEGVFRAVLALEPGLHMLKFSLGGVADGWRAPSWARQFDDDGNAVIHVRPRSVLLESDRDEAWAPRQSDGVVTFTIYRPQAEAVYLAGDFNNWADNDEGHVSDRRFIMDGPDAGGLWTKKVPLAPGRHAYQFVIDGRSWQADPNVPGLDAEGHSII